jgi:hypothetical protein
MLALARRTVRNDPTPSHHTMSDTTLQPFRCPAQICYNDEQGSSLGDAKRFYLHWLSVHKPRCPRTDCKFSLQDLSKTTESYFLRHWATHFPELNPGKTACDKCGRRFANANNRDRHAIKCESIASEADNMVTSTGYGNDMELPNNEFGARAADLDCDGWAGIVGDTYLFGTLPSYDGDMSFLNEFAVSSVSLEDSSVVRTITSPMPTPLVAEPIVNLCPEYAMVENTHALPLLHGVFSQPLQAPRAVEFENELLVNDEYSKTYSDRMPGTRMLEATMIADTTTSSSRKRLCEGLLTEGTKRHQSADLVAKSHSSQSRLRVERRHEALLHDGMASSMVQDTSSLQALSTQVHHQNVSGGFQATNSGELLRSETTINDSLPFRIRKQYMESHSPSRHVRKRKQLLVVKSFVQTGIEPPEVSCDVHTWIRKINHKHRKTTCTTSHLVNNVLISKETRFPRVCMKND